VCIAGSSGDFEVEASGLQPRSVLQLTSDKLGDSSYTITDAGEPDGESVCWVTSTMKSSSCRLSPSRANLFRAS